MARLTKRSAVIFLFMTGTAAAAPVYTVQNIVDPDGNGFTEVFGINDAGAIVGTDNAVANQGFTLAPNGRFTPDNVSGAQQTQVTGIAGNNTTVGIFVDQNGTTHGFAQTVTTTGTQTSPFNQPGTAFNQLLGVSANGAQFAGYSSIDPMGQVLQKAYVGSIQNHTFTDVNHLLPTNFNSQATGVNNTGDIVGFFQPSVTTSLGFEDIGGVIGTVDPYGSTFTQALGIASDGEVVGFYVDGANVQHGYIDINGTITTFDPAGSASTTINGVNDLGQIVGFYTTADDTVVGFVATPQTSVPEPASITLFGPGLLGLGLLGLGRVSRRQFVFAPSC
jgi:hypothetical protein